MSKPIETGFVSPKTIAYKRQKQESKNAKDNKVDITFLKICPYKAITSEGYVLMEDNTYMEMFAFKTHALAIINCFEKQTLLNKLSNFYRLNIDDIKITELKYPAESQQQQDYWLHRYEHASNDIQKLFAIDNINKLQISDRIHLETEYYLFIYADTKKEMSTYIKSVLETNDGLLKDQALSTDKKKRILFKLNNMNTQL